MTKAAKEFGKDLQAFSRLVDVEAYLDELRKTVKKTDLIETHKGRFGGSWAHPKLAVFFSRWLDVRSQWLAT